MAYLPSVEFLGFIAEHLSAHEWILRTALGFHQLEQVKKLKEGAAEQYKIVQDFQLLLQQLYNAAPAVPNSCSIHNQKL